MRTCIALILLLLAVPAAGQDAGPDAAQGWTGSEREIHWNSPVGSRLIPFAWFPALERRDAEGLFAEPAHLARYGFLPASANAANPGLLPVGLSRERDRADGLWLGVTCAACHVRDIAYRGATTRVEGAGSMLDLQRFDRDLAAALDATARDDARFARFAARLATPDAERPALHDRLTAIAALRLRTATMDASSVRAGPGRFDLMGTLINALAGPAAAPAAPVRFPRLWGSPALDRTLTDGSGGNAGAGPLLRDIGQVLATYGTVDVSAPPPYPSSVSLPDLLKIEALLRKLEPPAWPASLPPIDPARATAGAAIFAQACASCHVPGPRGKDGLVPSTRVLPDQLGTDPAALRTQRMVETGALQGRGALGPTALSGSVIAHVAAGIAAPRFRADPLPPLREAYRATPLAGIWSSAPYLHNGAVPNLWQLLTPAAERVPGFSLAPQDYDPVAVGLPTSGSDKPRLDASQPGNAAAGHEYGTTLPEEARRNLLEYLKTL